METDVQQRIRDRAYAIWVEEGCPHGRDTDHWLQAERDIAVSLTDTAPAALATAMDAEPAGMDAELPTMDAELPSMDAEPAASKPKRARTGTATPKAVADAKTPAKKTATRKKADGDGAAGKDGSGAAVEKAEAGAPKAARTRRKSSATPA